MMRRYLIAAEFIALSVFGVECTSPGDPPRAHSSFARITDSVRADPPDDDDLEVLAAWSYVYRSVSTTKTKPSDVFCGNYPKGTIGEGCPPNAEGGVARERVEIRGFVSSIEGYNNESKCPKCGDAAACEDEYVFHVMPDVGWRSTASGVYPINSFHEVGAATTPYNMDGEVNFPWIKIEVDGWGSGRMCHVTARGPQVFTPAPVDWKPAPGDPWRSPMPWGTRWSFDPEHPPSLLSGSLKVGDYVRVVGTLWEDRPHEYGGCWRLGKTHGRGWVEIHPVDFVARLVPSARNDTLVRVRTCYPGQETTQVIRPPGPRPSLNASVGFEEIVDPAFTVWASVNDTTNRVTVLSDGIRVHIRLKGVPPNASPLEAAQVVLNSKFSALYRVYWRH